MATLARPTTLVCILATILAAFGCSNKTSDRDLETLSVQESIELANSKSGGPFSVQNRIAWVDPRSEEEFKKAHIPGAVNIPFGGPFERLASQELRGVNAIVVYATSVQDVLGTAASKRLIELGYQPVYTLKGGLRQWMRDGNKVDGTDPSSAE